MMMGNHRTPCTFTMQQIGTWVVTDSNVHGHCFAISRKLCPVDSLYEPALETCIRTLESLRINSIAYR